MLLSTSNQRLLLFLPSHRLVAGFSRSIDQVAGMGRIFVFAVLLNGALPGDPGGQDYSQVKTLNLNAGVPALCTTFAEERAEIWPAWWS